MAITVDATSTGGQNSITVLTFEHIVSAGDNRILIVGVAQTTGSTPGTITHIKFGGVDLTASQSQQVASGDAVDIYYLLSPSVSTANIVVTVGTESNFGAYGLSLFGIDQTTPIGATNSANSTGTTPSVSVTPQYPTSYIVDAGASGSGTAVSPGSNQTEILDMSRSGGRAFGGYEPTNSGTPVVMDWTSGNASWLIMATEIKPSRRHVRITHA